MKSKFRTLLGLSAALLTLAVAAPVPIPIDSSKSSVVAQFTQMKVPVEAPFRKFTGSVHYSLAKPGAAKAHLEIDMSSLDVGDEDYNAEVRKKEWFNSARYPTAIFEATTIKSTGDNRFRATGVLNLKGRTKTMTVQFTLVSADGLDTFEGSVPISRADFDIGDSQWKDTVADEVLVKFRIIAATEH